MTREPQEGDVLGRELSDAVFAVLSSSDASPQTYGAIAGELVRRGRLAGEPGALAPTVAAAVRADSRKRDGERARFRHVPGGVALSDWYLPRDAVFRERDAVRAAERQRHEIRRAFIRKIADLPPAGFAELIATWLSTEGVGSLRGVRRPTSSAQEMHFAGVLRSGHEETRLAILVVRDARELTRERVIEMRGSLHHYGSASETWVVSLGQVPRATREEAQVPGATPVSIWDGLGLAEAMEARRVGLIPMQLPISAIDLDLLDALRGQPDAPQRDWSREGGRENRDGGRDRDRDREPREGQAGREAPREQREPRPTETAVEGGTAEAQAPSGGQEGVAPEGGAAPSGETGGNGEQGEGGRRRRRRRRRRGGPGTEPTGAEAAGDEEGEEVEVEVDEGTTTPGEAIASGEGDATSESAPAPEPDASDDEDDAPGEPDNGGAQSEDE